MAGAVLGLLAVPLLFAVLASFLPRLATLPPFFYTPGMLAVALAIALLVPMLGSVLPALRIVRLDAAVALTGSAEAPAPARYGARTRREESLATYSPVVAARPFSGVGAQLGLMRQILIVTRIGFATLRQRVRSALLITGGVGFAMLVMLWFLCMAQGIRTAILDSGDPARVLLRGASTRWLAQSRLPEGVAASAASVPGVARAADGSPLAEAMFHATIGPVVRRSRGTKTGIDIVGVGPHWREMTPSFRLLSGRLPTPGTNEVMVGRLAPRALFGLDGGAVKRTLAANGKEFEDVEWQVVGTFTTGDWWDGYLVGDIDTLRQYGRGLDATTVRVRLDSPQSFEVFRSAVARQLPPSVKVERETDYYAGFWSSIPKFVLYVAYLLGGLLGLGAIAATTQVTHAALEARRREIATLRLLGFDGRAAAASLALEAMLFAVLGALLAATLMWFLRDGDVWAGAGSVFEFKVDLHLVLVATGWAAAFAMMGTLPMAVRTLRRREVEALQELREVDKTSTAAPRHRRREIAPRPSLGSTLVPSMEPVRAMTAP
jgi:putative ABC transport system permease protein